MEMITTIVCIALKWYTSFSSKQTHKARTYHRHELLLWLFRFYNSQLVDGLYNQLRIDRYLQRTNNYPKCNKLFIGDASIIYPCFIVYEYIFSVCFVC